MTGLALALAPIDGLYDAVDLPRPDPAGIGVVAGAALILAAAVLAAKRTRPLVTAAATADVLAAVVLAAWLTTDPADGIGTVLLVVAAVSLVAQAAVDVWALTRPRP